MRVLLALQCFLCLVFLASATTTANTPKVSHSKKISNVWDYLRGDHGKEPKIINGTLAIANATRYQVGVRKKLNDGWFFGTGHICGASLIAPNVVLSAAHCFVDYDDEENPGTLLPTEDFIVVMGNLDRFEQDNNTFISDIKEIIYAVDRFNLSTFEKDIALLILEDSVPANHTTLSPIDINRKELTGGTVCQVTGWGTTEDGYLSDVLMTLDVPIIDFGICANWTDFAPGLIRPGMLCAGYKEGERDACSGDSGGPLACNGKQAGIVSWGIDCAQPRLPGVYTNVAFYASWIDAQLKTKNITIPNDKGGGAAAIFTHSVSLISLLITVITLIFNQ